MKLRRFKRMRLGKPYQLTAGLSTHEHPAVSPDGRWLAYYAGAYGSIDIVVCSIDGRFARVVSPHGGNNTQASWRPDSGAITYRHQHANEAKWELWETTLEGSDTTPRMLLANSRWNYKHPEYSPDGKTLTYFSEEDSRNGAYHIWLWDIAAGERKQVTFGDTQMHCHPVFSPDGTRIAFHAYEGTDESKLPAVTNLCELDIASGTVTQLTTGQDQYKHPFYVDDDVLVFHHERNADGCRGLEAMHLATQDVIELTDGECNDKHPYPFTLDGKPYLAWASKKLAEKLDGSRVSVADSPRIYDIFFARLRFDGKKAKRKKA